MASLAHFWRLKNASATRYVGVSRGAEDAQLCTNDREKLPEALGHDVSHESTHVPTMKPEQSIKLPLSSNTV